jgi:diguanylate cyclase (GGDEF)-like protein
VGVLALMVAFAGAGAVVNARLAATAQEGVRLSELYQAVERALLIEDAAEQRLLYRRQAPQRLAHAAAAGAVLQALVEVRAAEQPDHRGHVDELVVEHRDYLIAAAPLLDRVQRTSPEADGNDVAALEREFQTIRSAVAAEAVEHREEASEAIAALRRSQRLVLFASPVIFGAGLVLVAMFARVLRGHRREIAAQAADNRHQALHDALTGLPNRTLLGDRFAQALRADVRSATVSGLLLIDLDRFKEVNDTFGHHYGDELLNQVGPRLRTALREADTVARLGGDEFAVLLPDVGSLDEAVAVAGRLRAVLEAPFRVEGVDLDVEASVGVVVSGQHGTDGTTLLQRADIAMYVAKSQSLGVVAYNPDDDGHSPARLALLGDLRRGLERGELVLHYQPKISVSTGDVVGAEALVRWQHPERGLVCPDDFIPMAERTGLIGPLTRRVLDLALGQARTWVDAGRPLTVSVNLSARNLLDEALPDMVAELLAAHRIPAALLELEVTESALMIEPARAQRLLEQLSAMGVRISLDDFGAGYTSLGQLKTLPISELKIDRSFVLAMTDDTSDALIVRSVIDLGHNLGLTIVAEGVETQQALAALTGFGCDVAQGYHLSRPTSVEVFDAWCANRRITPVHPVATALRADFNPGATPLPDRVRPSPPGLVPAPRRGHTPPVPPPSS